MKVSVLIITYNQEDVIAQTVNGALMQQVNFPYEIVIGEDVSTDRTREIVLEFQKKHPDKVRVMLRDPATSERDRSLGLGGKTNFMQGLADCRGDYIALLDGDDYWTDPGKLQKQVDFLDRNPDFAISYHNVTMLYEDGSREPANMVPPDQKEVATIEDLFAVNFIPTCSAVFRRGLFGALPNWFHDLKIGDWPLHIMNARHGKIGYINEVMATYRFHQGGYWSRKSDEDQALEIVKMLSLIDGHLDYTYKKGIREAKARWYYHLAQQAYGRADRNKSHLFLRKYFWLRGYKGTKELAGLFLRLRVPRFYKYLISLRAATGSDTSHSSNT